MATPNYELHQWGPGDRPTRSDFNEDFRTIDTALHDTHQQAERGLEGVERVGYHAASVMLQQAYSGQSVQYQDGAFVDAFVDNSCISSLTSGFERDPDQKALKLANGAAPTINVNYGTSYTNHLNVGEYTVISWTAPLTGTLVKAELYITGNATLRFQTVDVEAERYTEVGTVACNGNVVLNMSLSVTQGKRYGLQIDHISGATAVLYSSKQNGWGGARLTYGQTTASSGTMITRTFLLTRSFTGLRGWVRHSTGTTALLIRSGSDWQDCPLVSKRTGYRVQGGTCIESFFSLEGLPAQNSLQLRLDATVPTGSTNYIYEYAALLL